MAAQAVRSLDTQACDGMKDALGSHGTHPNRIFFQKPPFNYLPADN